MAREWFDLNRREGRPVYLHSKTRTSAERVAGMSDEVWSKMRRAFFGQFPRASEVRVNGCGSLPICFIPDGAVPVFSPGDRLLVSINGRRKEFPIRVAGVQMPLFGEGDPPSYLLDDGAEVVWSSRLDCWMIKTAGALDVEVGSASKIKVPVRKKSPLRRDVA
jgi:hypothetical protein